MVRLHYNKQYFDLPAEYNELSPEQLLQIAAIRNLDKEEIRIQLEALKVLLGYSKVRFLRLHADLLSRMLPYAEWVFNENTLTEQLLPFYDGFYGPKKELENLIMKEFHLSEVYYHDLVVEKDESAVNKLIAVLYRLPKQGYDTALDTDGDIRVSFNANEVEYYSKAIAPWPQEVKEAILMFYDGCRQHLVNLYDNVFEGGSGEDNDAGMFDIIRGLAGPKYGTVDNVELVNLHTALHELDKQIVEAEELERKMDSL